MRYRVGHSVKVRLNGVSDLTLRVVDILPNSRLRLYVQYPTFRVNGSHLLDIPKSAVLEHYGVEKDPETDDIGQCQMSADLLEGQDPELPSLVDKKIMEVDKEFFLGRHIKWCYGMVDGARLETEGYILLCRLDSENPIFICSEMFCSQPDRHWIVSPYVVDYLLPYT